MRSSRRLPVLTGLVLGLRGLCGGRAPPSGGGKVGVWSKTDSISEFADYVVTPEGR